MRGLQLTVTNLVGSADGDLVHSDDVVRVSGEEGLSVLRPGQGDALWGVSFAGGGGDLWLELLDLLLVLEIPDLDRGSDGGAKPISVWRERHGVDDVVSGEGVQVLALVEVPEHGLSVLSSGGTERTIWGDGDGVDVSGVADVVGLQAAVSEVPDLDDLVPSSGDDHWIAVRWRESDGRNPVGVAVIL